MLMEGKKGVVFGVANKWSIAWAISKALHREGAQIILTYLGDEEKIKEFLRLRKEKQPLEFPSAGSVFKNVPIEKVPKKIREKFKEKIKDGFLPAGVLIEAAGLKGFQIGGARISEKHANFIVNVKNAKANDVVKLIELIKKKVKRNFNIELEEEVKLVGF